MELCNIVNKKFSICFAFGFADSICACWCCFLRGQARQRGRNGEERASPLVVQVSTWNHWVTVGSHRRTGCVCEWKLPLVGISLSRSTLSGIPEPELSAPLSVCREAPRPRAMQLHILADYRQIETCKQTVAEECERLVYEFPYVGEWITVS